jgi:N-acetylneuraminic acid mutarotase
MKRADSYTKKAQAIVLGSVLALFVMSALLPVFVHALSFGDLSPWQTANSLSGTETSSTSVVYNGYVYEIGGEYNGQSTNKVYYASLNTDGSVGSWQTASNSLPASLEAATSVVYNGYVYVMGGESTNGSLSTVYYASLNADGSVGSWQTASNSLPASLGGATSVVYNGYVYVMGGEDASSKVSSVYYAKLNSNGSVGTWQTSSSSLPDQISGATTVVNEGYVYVLGGEDNNYNIVTSIYYASLNADGSVSTWQTASNNTIDPVAFATAVTSNGYIYVMGGYDNNNDRSAVYYSKIDSPYINTKTIANAVNSSPVIMDTVYGTNITCSNAVSETALSKQDISYSYPIGLVNLCFTTPTVNNQITLTFVTSLTPSQVVPRDYNSTTQTYMNIPGAVVTETSYNGQPALQLAYNISDNGPLDSNSSTGAITDPVGLALELTSSVTATAPNTGFGTHENNTVTNIILTVLFGSSLITVGFGLRTLTKRH